MLTPVAPGVLVTTSRRMSTTTTILTDGTSALLVDPAWMPDELELLSAELSGRDLTVIGGFSTHAHHDHLLWHPGFGEVARWASPATASLAASERDALVAHLGPEFPQELVDLMGRVTGVTDTIPTSALPQGFDVELIVHDGHAPGHTALWLPRQQVVIAGDMLSDIELPLPFWPDDLPSYMTALDRLAPIVAQASVVIPGHGNVGHDPVARLDADRRYLDDVVRGGLSNDARIGNAGMAEEYAHLQRLSRTL